METLYQTWGKQMSFKIKQERLSENSSFMMQKYDNNENK
jgi:hypothetical protein